MNSRLDWLVLSDYYSIYVTNASAKQNKREVNRDLPFCFTKLCWVLLQSKYFAKICKF